MTKKNCKTCKNAKTCLKKQKTEKNLLLKKLKINSENGQRLLNIYCKLKDKKTKDIIEFIKKRYNIYIILLKCLKLSKKSQRIVQKIKGTETIPHSTIVKKFKEKLKWRKSQPKLAKLQDIWWWIRFGIKNKIVDFPREVKYFIQRGKRGYSNRDVWGFDYYLAKVISGGIDKLIKNIHGYPGKLKNIKQWISILRKIKKTFVMAEKISDGELMYLPTGQYDYNDEKRKYWIKYTKDNNKEWDKNDRVMTKKENLAYLEGWRLFREYFGSLWD